MELTLSEIYMDENIQDALVQLRDRKNSHGADGLKISELPEFWKHIIVPKTCSQDKYVIARYKVWHCS